MHSTAMLSHVAGLVALIAVDPGLLSPEQINMIHDIRLPGHDVAIKHQLEVELRKLMLRVEDLRCQASVTSSPSPAYESPPGTSFCERTNLALPPQARPASSLPLGLPDGQLMPLSGDGQQPTSKCVLLSAAKQLSAPSAEAPSAGRHGGCMDSLQQELLDCQRTGRAFRDALGEIRQIIVAVTQGDLTVKAQVNVTEADPEIQLFKQAANSMVDRLQSFAREVSRVAREVATEGLLGGQAQIGGVDGTWRELMDHVNLMALNLTEQVRETAAVTTAVAHGDLTKKIQRPAKGEILQLQLTVNTMVEQLRIFASEVTRVARDVGTGGILGRQAEIEEVQGMWRELTVKFNAMARDLTTQVRALSYTAHLATDGDLTKPVDVEALGEMGELKRKTNQTISNLQESTQRNIQAREAAELASRAKSEFLVDMSHKIRTLVNGIVGVTQLSLDTSLTQFQREILKIVNDLANSLLAAIDNILDLSRIEARRMPIEEVPYMLRGTVFNALKTLGVKANEKPLDLIYKVGDTVPDYIMGDPLRLRQILLNLVGNAIKFTDNGWVSLEVSGQPISPDDQRGKVALQFAVQDTGIGIAEEKLGLIFDTFQQADGSVTRKFGGTGLGLSISKQLIQLMGGRIWVESEEGRGSKFYFTVLTEPAPNDARIVERQIPACQGRQILFAHQAQPSSDAVVAIGDKLRQLGLGVTVLNLGNDIGTAKTPADGALPYDTILVDSVDTARGLRALDQFKYLPIALLSPPNPVSLKSCLELGIASYVAASCKLVDLENGIIPALKNRAATPPADRAEILSILLAEDSVVNQKLAVKILEKHSHVVTVVNNGLEAVEAAKDGRFHLILMDVQMPVMGGFEATARIRAHERDVGRQRTPIVALTAHAMTGDRDRCLRAQMDDYLSKPLQQSQLLQVIRACALGNSEAASK